MYNIMFLKRTIIERIKQVNKTFPALIITGARQVGKTTVLKQYIEDDREYITFDNLLSRQQAINDPALFMQNHKGKLFIDEIQYSSDILSYIKMDIDNNKEYGKFWFTGSQQFNLMKNISESLAGRICVLNLQGLSQDEKFNLFDKKEFEPTNEYLKQYNNLKNIEVKELFELILRGSFPELVVNKDLRINDFYYSYLQTYIEQDIKQLINVANENTFLKFMQILASRTGQILNYSDIAKDVGVSNTTIKAWISILETSGIIYLLQPYYKNINSRLVKSPKVYFLDTGLACYLCGWQTADVLEKGAFNGHILETYVISEILKTYWYNGERPMFYFYRDNNQREIDLIIEKNNKLYLIEVKKTAMPKKNDIKHFSVLDTYEQGIVVCLVENTFNLTNKDIAINIKYL